MKSDKGKSKNLRAASYERVSSDEQAKGYSLLNQREAIKEQVARDRNVLNERNVYADDGYTGINGERPALKAMVEAARRGEIDIIYVWKIDRLFRNTKLILNLVDELEKLGVMVKSVTEPYDTSTPIGRYIFTTLAAGAEMEHANINERTYVGKVRAMKEGKWLGGTPPYGLDLHEKKLRINKEEAGWVKKFFRWFVNERLTLCRLQRRVNALGIPTKHVNLNRIVRTGRKTSKTFWNKRTIGRILSNEIYTGTFYYRKYKNPARAHKDTELRPKEDWIVIHPPVIVSKELFDDAQKQLRINKDNSPRKTKRLYLLAKKLTCGICGHKLNAAFRNPKKGTNQSGTRYYKGAWVMKQGTDKRCDNCYFYSEPRLDKEIWDGLKNLLSDPTTAIQRIESHALNGKSYDNVKEELERLEVQQKEVADQKQKAFVAYTDGYVDYPAFRKVAIECDRTIESVKSRKQELSQSLLSEVEKAERIASAKELYQKMRKILDSAPYEMRCKVVSIFVENVILTGNDAAVEMYLPYRGYIPQLMPQFKEIMYGDSRELLWDRRGVGGTLQPDRAACIAHRLDAPLGHG